MAEIPSVSAWENRAHLPPRTVLIFLTSCRLGKVVVSLTHWAGSCCFWLDLWSPIEFPSIEHTRKLPSPPPPTLIPVRWKSQNIPLMLTSGRRSFTSPDTREVRCLTQWRKNMSLPSSARLIRKLWTQILLKIKAVFRSRVNLHVFSLK